MSALESAFLGLESRDVPFHFASILEVDRPIAVEQLRSHVDSVLGTIPRYRQRIVRSRWRGARWVDVPDFRIENHVGAVTVAAPGGRRELDELVAHLLETELPAVQPPWRLWAVHGVEGGRGAVIALMHHSLVDGMAGFRLLQEVLRGPVPAALPPAPPPPSRRKTQLGAMRELVTWKNARALGKLLREGLTPADQLGINPRRVGRTRVVASHTVDLDAVEQIEHAFSATNNDVVLATVTGALRRLLIERGLDPDQMRDVRVMVPVGRHGKTAREAYGNRVVLLLVPIPVYEADPAACLQTIARATRHLKRSHTAAGGDLLVALSDVTLPAVLYGVLAIALRMRAFNLIVTNVPGPPKPLSLLGTQLTRIVPIVNLWPHVALGIAVASYARSLTFGIQTDHAVIPDATRVRDHLAAAFEALRDAAAHAHAA
ncbi:MAG TPA: wax ester/triacylglycerol synthase domain-containing protein [Kofleriaceae bacterium]|nr:wax ester/triacylglycerol synthase domain-containing protein [Kofleriaceae bacterium]